CRSEIGEGLPRAAPRDLADAQKRSDEELRANRGMMMSRLTLIALQILVAVVGIAIWHILTSVPIAGVIVLPPFFFSTPFDVVARIWRWFATGSVWIHLGVTLL